MGNRQSILPIQTTADLVSRIVSTCSDVFSWSQKEELVRFLHFFEATVGKVGDDETRLLEEFTAQSRQLHMLSEKYRHYTQEKDSLLDKLLDIRPQTSSKQSRLRRAKTAGNYAKNHSKSLAGQLTTSSVWTSRSRKYITA